MASGWAVLLNDLHNVVAIDSPISADSLLDQHGATAGTRLRGRGWWNTCTVFFNDYVVWARTSADFANLMPGIAATAAGARGARRAFAHDYLLFASDGAAAPEVGNCKKQPGDEQEAGDGAQDDSSDSPWGGTGIETLVRERNVTAARIGALARDETVV